MMSRSFTALFALLVGVVSLACAAPPAEQPPPDRSAREDDSDANEKDGANEKESTTESALREQPTSVPEGGTCGGASTVPCQAGLVCVATPTASGAPSSTSQAGRCQRPGETGAACTIDGDCRAGLTCNRKDRSSTPATCGLPGDDDEEDDFFCKQLSRCCGRIASIVNRLACGGTVAAGNEKACSVALALCGGG